MAEVHASAFNNEAAAHSGSNTGGLNEGIFEGFLASWSIILISEIGDKTFFIACLMAMCHPKLLIFAAAQSALVMMTGLSAALGWLMPSILSVRVTQVIAIVAFSYFGVTSLREGFKKTPSGEEGSEELDGMSEAAAAIGKRDDVEEGKGMGEGGEGKSSQQGGLYIKSFFLKFFSPVFVQAFVLTFLAEWGDRSQISTLVLGAAKNPIGVTLGGTFGHFICTSAAVILGAVVAQRITPKMVNISGGFLFILFALHTGWEFVHAEEL